MLVMVTAADRIATAAMRAAARHGAIALSDKVACYLLRMDARLSFDRIAEDHARPRVDVVRYFNEVSVGLCSKDPKICAVITTARLLAEREETEDG